MYDETLRRNSYSDHEGSTAQAYAQSFKHEHAAPKSHHSQPYGLLDLQPNMTVSRSSTHSSPRRRASHRRDAFKGL
ncbi:hypothetical protein C8Q72DRAFT_818424 [Fomitopsis betulina]|nr:hypothetical protein C8Q72DRAFT_818424 [Fomitopsis betulina]